MRGIEIHHNRARFREFMRLVYPRTIAGLITWPLMKLGVVRWQPQIMRWQESLWDSIVEPNQLPEIIRDHLSSMSAQLADLGFVEPLIEHEKSKGPDGREIVGVCLRARHSSGLFMLQALFSVHAFGIAKPEDQLVSFLDDEQLWATSNGRRKFDPPPGFAGKYYPGANVDELVTHHQDYLNSLSSTPISIRDNNVMIQQTAAFRERFYRHMIERGVFREIELDNR